MGASEELRPFEQLYRLEQLAIQGKQRSDDIEGEQHPWMRDVEDTRFGIALSGGGIRSATFNLGLLQALDKHRVLERADYLATVSGGGYIGGFWTAWRKRKADAAGNEDGFRHAFPRDEKSGQEAKAVRRLREFSNFLAPRLGVLTHDTGRIVTAVLEAFIPAVLTGLSVIALTLAVWLGARLLVLGTPPAIGALVLGVLLLMALSFGEKRFRETELSHGNAPKGWRAFFETRHLGWSICGFLVVLLLGYALLSSLQELPLRELLSQAGLVDLPYEWRLDPTQGLLYLFGVSATWFAASLVVAGLGLLISLIRDESIQSRATRRRVEARLLSIGTAWLAIAMVWPLAGLTFTGVRQLGLAGIFSVLFAWARSYYGREPNRPSANRPARRISLHLVRFLAYLAIVPLAVGVAGLFQLGRSVWPSVATSLGVPDGSLGWILAPIVGPALVACVLCVLMLRANPNEISLHRFYRERLVRAFLGASNTEAHPREGTPQRSTGELPSDDFAIDDVPWERPVHLLCCAANDVTLDRQISNLRRGAVSAVISPVGFSVDGDSIDWDPDKVEPPTLGAAMTASAAAFNSLMGSMSIALGPAVAFLMTTLNFRLGYWLRHPRAVRKSKKKIPGRGKGWLFFREMFGRASTDADYVHLSDGGHFENLALYELIRRHCQYVIVSDCGMDPDVAFDDFGNAVRKIREDFRVEIKIDLTPLRPGPDGRAGQPMVAGDIEYPSGDPGVLLYVKPTLVGNEPADVLQYHSRNEKFPHESTTDQFYDEAQWEAYRALGEHAGDIAFEFLGDIRREVKTLDIETSKIFANARRRWSPLPRDIERKMQHIEAGVAEIEKALIDADSVGVMESIYPGRKLQRTRPRRLDRALNGRIGAKTSGLANAALAPSILRFMENVYHLCELEREWNHPAYLGLMNYMARWANTPDVRVWWPTLRSLHGQQFAGFVETQFGLEGARGTQGKPKNIGQELRDELNHSGVNVAIDALRAKWRAKARYAPRLWLDVQQDVESRFQDLIVAGAENDRPTLQVPEAVLNLVSYRVGADSKESSQFDAAFVLLRFKEELATWDADDFFVPPGFWGAGIGSTFLGYVTDALFQAEDERENLLLPGFGRVEELVVRIKKSVGLPAVTERGTNDLVQLYRNSGWKNLSSEVAEDGAIIERARKVIWHPSSPHHSEDIWMTMTREEWKRARVV